MSDEQSNWSSVKNLILTMSLKLLVKGQLPKSAIVSLLQNLFYANPNSVIIFCSSGLDLNSLTTFSIAPSIVPLVTLGTNLCFNDFKQLHEKTDAGLSWSYLLRLNTPATIC